MIKRKNKKSNLREYFSYFLILSSVIIVISGSLYFYFSLETLKETNIRNREESLKLMQNTFENLISQIENSITLSQFNFRQYKKYYDQGSYTILLLLHDELASLKSVNHIQSACIYFREWDYTVFSESVSQTGLASIEYNTDSVFLKSID